MAARPAPETDWYVAAMTRWMGLMRWRGANASRAVMVEQFGFATSFCLPSCCRACGFTSGMTRGTSLCKRKCEELSMTRGIFEARVGRSSAERVPPAQAKARCV